MWTSGYRSRIDKKTETGSPGYYAVTLVDAHTRVELTATERTGWLRYLPAPGKAAHLLFDFDVEPEETSQLLELEVHRDGDRALAGLCASATSMPANTRSSSAPSFRFRLPQ